MRKKAGEMYMSAMADGSEPSMGRKIELCPTLQAPGEARRFVRQHAVELGFPRLVDDAEAVISELATNALEAAAKCPPWVHLRPVSGMLLLEVEDRSPDLPVFREPDYVAERGRGLHVVSALAVEIGWYRVLGGKIVWA